LEFYFHINGVSIKGYQSNCKGEYFATIAKHLNKQRKNKEAYSIYVKNELRKRTKVRNVNMIFPGKCIIENG
jgi:hypothetical protein